ncbi:MAG: arsenic transporter [Firmicutes bacterium]|nr:arsenic transporter [Bacillota bacterium]
MERFLLAGLLFATVLVFITVRPRRLSIGWSATGGGILALLLGLVTLRDVLNVARLVWDATLTFVALVMISLVLDRAGFFQWAALRMAQGSRGRGPRLFFLLTLLGAMVSMLFANDGAALILTPLVYEEAKALRLNRAATLAFVMASGFVADTTSLPLVVSNLVNILSADFFHWGFVYYAVRMLPVDGVSFCASLAILWVYFHRDIPRKVNIEALPDPQSAIRDRRVFRGAWVVLGLLLAGYFFSQLLHWPVAIFAGAAALALMGLAWSGRTIAVSQIVKTAPWNIVVFSLGMYLVVYGVSNAGLGAVLGTQLTVWGHAGLWAAIGGSGVMAAVFSSVMNNLPSVLVGMLAIRRTHVSPAVHTAMGLANVVGCDLGPKMTPIGSLATLLWLYVLNGRGLHIGWGYYLRVGVILTLPVLLATLAALWGWVAWLH